jgi:hypothetical protein
MTYEKYGDLDPDWPAPFASFAERFQDQNLVPRVI